MKLEFLGEMAAKAVCPKCGQGPISKTHYWYQGGWKCRAAKPGAAAPTAAPKTAVAAVKQVLPAKAAPAATGLKPITVDEIKKLVPMRDVEELGRDDVYWQVTQFENQISVYFTYTFRRNTCAGAYVANRVNIEAANRVLKAVAERYKANVMSLHLSTLDTAKESDMWRQQDGDDPYSEYEQTLGGNLELKAA